MEDVNRQTIGRPRPIPTPCLCAALRQASRAVTRIYDAELRGTGLRATQHSLLRLLGWVTIRGGADRREKLVAITGEGKAKIEQARPAWSRAQERMRRTLPDETWDSLFAALPDVTKAAASEDKIEGTS
jgi:hypothetical protein